MNRVFIARGSGYQDDRTFDGYEVIREPLDTREKRVLPHHGQPVDYRAFSIKFARSGKYDVGFRYLLIQHGGGTQVMEMHVPDAFKEAIAALPEDQAYAVLHTIYNTAQHADWTAREEVAREYSQAFVEGRLKKSRIKQGSRKVYIEAVPA